MVVEHTDSRPKLFDRQGFARIYAYSRLITDVILTIATFYYASQTDTWQINAVSGIVVVIALTTLIGTTLIHLEQETPGLKIILWGFIIGVNAISIFIAGLGFFAFAASVILTTLVVIVTLPEDQVRILLLGSLVIGLFSLVLDMVASTAAFRITIQHEMETPLLISLWIALGILIIFYAIPVIRNFADFPLRTKIMVTYITMALFSLGVLGTISTLTIRNTLVSGANEALYAAASQTADSVTDFFKTNLSSIEAESKLTPLIDYLLMPADQRAGSEQEASAISIMRTLQRKDLDLLSYKLLDPNGTVLLTSEDLGTEGGSLERGKVYTDIPTDGPAVSDVQVTPDGESAIIHFTSPVTRIADTSLSAYGILMISYDASVLQNLISNSNGLVGEDSFAVLFDEYFIHLAHGTSPDTFLQTVTPLDQELLTTLQAQGRLPNLPEDKIFLDLTDLGHHLESVSESNNEAVYFTSEDIATGDRLNQIVVVPLPNALKPWSLAFFQPRDTFLQPAVLQTRNTILISIAIASAVVALSLAFAQYLSRPIISLTQTAEEVAQGNFTARATVVAKDEIGVLAETFNTMTSQLNELITGLEQQVAERTGTLEQRAQQVQAAAEVARDATSETELDELLYQSVNLLADRFDFYHVGIYLVDVHNKHAVLMAASGHLGQLLLQNENTIRIGSNNPVGYATVTGEAYIATLGGSDLEIYRHMMLPDTRSQMSIPLQVGTQIVGALDIQSQADNAFDDNDVAILRTMADQLAVAIQKTELRKEVENTLHELESAYGEFTREAWRGFTMDASRPMGYRYRHLRVQPVRDQSQETTEAWQTGQTIIMPHKNENGDEDELSSLAVPIKIRGEVIGVLNMNFETARPSEIPQQMIEEIASRLSLVLENARLVEAAQKRVQMERLSAEIIGRIRENLEMDAVLKTALQEIGETFELNDIEVRIGSVAMQAGSNGDSGYDENEELFDDGDLNLDALIG
ncbi:MAG: GAF domain-containing protein [Anaerolineales bacterium]|nr:GAF domain-containing protein [Anaerolineales bacterium]